MKIVIITLMCVFVVGVLGGDDDGSDSSENGRVIRDKDDATWPYCRNRCASTKDTSELEWSACLYGCTASKSQSMSRSKDCLEWCDGVKESPQAETYMTDNPSDGEHLLWRATCTESCTSVIDDDGNIEL